ncbi:MAG: hypothetical protein CVU29_09160 [Betaproteobacteria bacterium HGW-Betaproteobacteria-22]|nr:MAG: hypothetical protein CVU29_09160 [Betaproteobacteria bacterium HGW-Betaproteobacteria-22]
MAQHLASSNAYIQYLMPLKRVCDGILLMLSFLLSPCTFADTLKDPTQPPAALYNQTGEFPSGELAAEPMLQSIIHGASYHAAIINGQKVLVGQKFNGATLIKLTTREAVLRNPDKSLQTLVLDFAIDKKTRPAAPAGNLNRSGR